MLTVDHLTYDYPGTRALDDVSFTIEKGSIVALVGPNGAGKSTLMRCISALDVPFAGQVKIDGLDVHEHPRNAHLYMGYLPDFYGLYEDLTVLRCLLYRAASQKIPADQQEGKARKAAERLGLSDRLQQKAGTLSRGLKQRLAIAQAILHEPKFILLDEPASGLDPEARDNLAHILRTLREEDMTLLVSSHILAELQDYSTHMLLIQNGQIKDYRPIRNIREDGGRPLKITLLKEDPRISSFLAELPYLTAIRVVGKIAHCRLLGGDNEQNDLLQKLIAKGFTISSLAQEEVNLQTLYLEKIKEGRPHA